MLIYHQQNDIYNCILRILSIVSLMDDENIDFEKLRIIDFYLTFPHFIKDISFPRVEGASSLKSAAKKLEEPYELLPSPKRLFSEMGDYQIQAVHILRAKKILTENQYGTISAGDQFSHKSISRLLANSSYLKSEFYVNLIKVIANIQTRGPNGIKSRSGLMEYRYDVE